MTAPAAVSWAARLGWLHLENTWLAFLGFAATPYILSVLAIGELINDKLPKTPSRKAPAPFIARVVVGALCGAALGATSDVLIGGLLAGVLGGVAGTLGGYEFRARLVRAIGGNDLPVALFEDAIAICGAVLIVSRFSCRLKTRAYAFRSGVKRGTHAGIGTLFSSLLAPLIGLFDSGRRGPAAPPDRDPCGRIQRDKARALLLYRSGRRK
jgi:uncharacterized membrane protein